MSMPHPLPTGQEQLVVALFGERAGAEQAITALQQAGFGQNQIGAVVRQEQHTLTPQAEAALDEEAEATGTGVAVGSVAGSAAGIATGAALGSIGGPIGTVIGGIAGALAGIAAGAAIGETLGERAAHTHHFGVPEERVQQYTTALEAGQIAVQVHARGVDDVLHARQVLGRFTNEIDVYDRRNAPANIPTNESGSEASGEPGL
jgi:phage tail tape-measure protein